MVNISRKLLTATLAFMLIFASQGCSIVSEKVSKEPSQTPVSTSTQTNIDSLENIPEYSGEESITINDNKVDYDKPFSKTFISLSELDDLGRCGSATAVIGPETLPESERESIGMVQPSGWPKSNLKNNKYDFVDGKYLFNRCHLIAFSLSGLNADKRNLITGTRTLNIKGMWEFEEEVLYYIKDTGNHVYYKVTPIFEKDNLLATGVHMEAKSLENDNLEFNVFCYNVEPGIHIDYETGENYAE